MQGLVRISFCQSGVVHVSIGAVTIHMDKETFMILSAETAKCAAPLRVSQKPLGRIFDFVSGSPQK